MLRTRSTKHASSTLAAAAASKRVILSVSSSRTFVGSFEEEDFDDERRRGKMMRSRHQQLNPIGSYSSSSSSSSSVKKSSFCRARFSTRSNTNDDIDNNTVIIINNNLRLRRQFFNSFRGYASSSNSTSKSSSNNSSSEKKNDSSGALTIEEDEEFDEITDKWIPEKPVTKAETAGYSVVIVLGLGLAASALFFASKELFMSPKEYVAFNAALKQIELDPRVTSALGESITGYGSESRNRSQRQRIPHTIVRDPASGREVVRVQFHARGARGNATVHAEYDPSNAEEPFGYLIVDVERPRSMRLVVKEPRQRRSIMGPGTSLVG
jgi:import inner membrane translocase subunit TIM21